MSDDPRASDPTGEIDSLGAAPTRPLKRTKGEDRGGGGRRRLARRARGQRPLAVVALVIGLAVALALVPAVVSSLKKTPPNMVGISYGGGPIEAANFQKIVQPGSGLFFNGLADPLYLYPADTQNYIVSKDPNQATVKAADSISAPTRDRVLVEYQVAVYFKLNIDRLEEFHNQLGLQYRAFQSAGWSRLIEDTFRQQIENALQENTRQYDVADIYGNADDLMAVQADVEQQLSRRLVGALGASYLCGPTYEPGGECTPPTFIIKKVDIPPDVAQAFETNRTSEIAVATSANEIAQRENEAKAIAALNQGLSQAGMNYVLLKAIESGKINFWVLPSDSGVELPSPQSGNGSTDTTTTTTVGGG